MIHVLEETGNEALIRVDKRALKTFMELEEEGAIDEAVRDPEIRQLLSELSDMV